MRSVVNGQNLIFYHYNRPHVFEPVFAAVSGEGVRVVRRRFKNAESRNNLSFGCGGGGGKN
jgi:hypothetical protein